MKKEKMIIDMDLMVRYAKLQEYYKELWEDYVNVCKENDVLRKQVKMEQRVHSLPAFPEV